METVKINTKSTNLIAHRGLSGLECENTAAAFVAAGNRGYYGIETDIHKTSDGKFVIFHDDTTGRLSDVNLKIENTAFSQLQELILKDIDGNKREDLRIPELKSYLRICKKYDICAVIELKNVFDEASVKEIMTIVKDEYCIKKIVFISFHYDNLVKIRNIDNSAEIQFLCACAVDKKLINSLKEYNFDIDIYHKYLKDEDIELLHNSSIKINCWTVDSKTEAEKLVKMGVDFITTNILEKAD